VEREHCKEKKSGKLVSLQRSARAVDPLLADPAPTIRQYGTSDGELNFRRKKPLKQGRILYVKILKIKLKKGLEDDCLGFVSLEKLRPFISDAGLDFIDLDFCHVAEPGLGL